MSIHQLDVGRSSICLSGGCAEPVVSSEKLAAAITPDLVEVFRPLLPVGYSTAVQAYQKVIARLDAKQLTTHYTAGTEFFHQEFVPQLKARLQSLSGGKWNLEDHVAFAAGSDVDLMTHVVNSVACRTPVHLFPGDWFGFKVGSPHQKNFKWCGDEPCELACLCVPSVRNGHLTEEMTNFLASAKSCLLNINLFPTLADSERTEAAMMLNPVLPRSILSVSFSRGFGLTASQLGVILVPRDHPMKTKFETQWNWFTFFYNAIAAQAFLEFDIDEAQKVDRSRAEWVQNWLVDHELPALDSGSYYVKSFRVEGDPPEYLSPLIRDNILRLCFKPPQT